MDSPYAPCFKLRRSAPAAPAFNLRLWIHAPLIFWLRMLACHPVPRTHARTYPRTHAHSLKTEISDLKTSITGNEATVFELLGPALKQHRCRADVGCMDPTPRLRSSSRPVNPSPRSVLFFYLYPTPLFLFISYSTAFRVGLRRRRPCDSHHRQAAGNPQRWLRVQVPGS